LFYVLELGTKRRYRTVHCFFYAFQAENASKDVTLVGATSKAGFYRRITHFFITQAYQYLLVPVMHFTQLQNLFVTEVVQCKTSQIYLYDFRFSPCIITVSHFY